jgi:hypothetical protein
MGSKIDIIIREVSPGHGVIVGDYARFRTAERNLIWALHLDLYDRGIEYIHGWERDTEDDFGLPRGSCCGFNLIFQYPSEVRRRLHNADVRDALRDPRSKITVILDQTFTTRNAWIRLPNGIIRLNG